MKIKHRQKKPKMLEKLLKKSNSENVNDLSKFINKIRIEKCPHCNKFYNADKNKMICSNCSNLLPG